MNLRIGASFRSCLGALSLAAAGLLFAASGPAHAAALLLTEIHSNPAAPGTEDYWELTNTGTTTVSVSNYKWTDSVGTFATSVAIPADASIAPGESVIFTKLDAVAFRTWWGIPASVQVFTGATAPGLGMNDGIRLYDAAGVELFFFSYAQNAFTRADGSGSAGGHAGVSAGPAGSTATQALVLNPTFGIVSPRYTAATVGAFGGIASVASALDIGSPGTSGLGGAPTFGLTVNITPAAFSESATNPAAAGTVTRSGANAAELVVNLSSNDVTEATVPATVTILAGQASANFNVTAVNDTFPDGNRPVVITATATGATPGTFNLTVDDDGDVLTTNLMLTEVQSSQSAGAHAGAEDYWELTNFGASVVDLAGYSWHDSGRSSAAAQTWKLPSGSTINVGESVIFTVADPAAFRTWWGLPGTVKVFQTVGAPGLGQNDGVSFFDGSGNELFFFNYAAAGFTKGDGSPSTGTHAGPSAGGAADSVAAVWVPTSGTTTPRYSAATVGTFGAFQAAVGTDVGSPGITDGAPVAPTVSIAGAAVAEGNAGTVTLNLPVTRNNATTAFSVDYAVTGGNAAAGTDYVTLASGTLTFAAAGGTSQNIAITVNGDTAIEVNETIIVTLSNVVNTTGVTTIATAAGTGTITNDDFVPVTFPASGSLTSTVKGNITLAGAEIPAFDPVSKRAFTSSGTGIQVVDLTNPASPVFISTITPATLGVSGLTSNDISSVAVRKGDGGANPSVLAAAIISSPKTSPGYVVFLNAATGALLGSIQVGPNPDHLAFTPDGTKVLVANEGEIAGAVAADTTPGSVSIINVAGGFAAPTETRAGFAAFDAQAAALKLAGVRIFQDGVPSTDFEPEYFAVSPDSTKAMVTLQEANAVAILDLASGTFTSIVPLGKKNFATLRADFSDRDGAGATALANPTTGSPVYGLYMPDAIAAYQAGGQTYYVTANEGDDRNDFLDPDESTTVGNAGYDLDNTVFPDEAALKTSARLGRLTVSNAPGLRGDTDSDGDIDEILSYGGRSFTILDSNGAPVFDSGDMLEMIIASQFPLNFDDTRSDNKGPEPEGVTVATLGGRTYAFVGMERSHMVLAFDVTNPMQVSFVSGFTRPGDLNPEGLVVVPAEDSPTSQPLLLVTNEVSNTLTIYELGGRSLMLTEVQSNQTSGSGGADFWELTNFGNTAVNLAGYTWHDEGRNSITAQAWKLPAGSTIMPGESVIFTSATPAAFRTTWGLNSSVKVFQTVGVPGLGGDDGVSFFDSNGTEVFYFNYDANGFTRADGSPSGGGHAGLSAGGAAATVSAVWVPSSGTVSPRYTGATAGTFGAFAATTAAADIGSPGVSGRHLNVDLSTYIRTGRYDLPEPTRTTPPNAVSLLAQEASGVTYNWDTDSLFITADGGTSIVQVSKTGQLIDSMTLAPGGSPQGTDFYDPEGITYVGNGQFVMSEERDRQVVLFTYAAGTTLNRAGAKTVKLGTFVDNTGTEGLSYDPQTSGFVVLKEIDPIGIFQTNIDFDAGTATNGSASTVNSTNLFDPALLGMIDVADVFTFSNLPGMSRQAQTGSMLVLSQENARIVNVNRSGVISSTLNIQSDPGNPFNPAQQQHEGITMDRNGVIYVVNENGGGDSNHPQLWVYAPSPVPNQAPTALALAGAVTSLQENTSTAARVKVADIVITDDGLGTNNLTITGADAASFEIVAGALFLKVGVLLDFETKTSYSITVNVDDTSVGATPDATVNYTLAITDQVVELPPLPAIIISEVAAWSSSTPVGSDWFEVTNTSALPVDITGWKVDDSSAAFATSLVLNGITSIAPGESVVFMEIGASDDPATKTALLKSTWFGAAPPASLQVGTYSGSGIGLGSGAAGDGVNLYNAAGVLQASVSFGASPSVPPLATFNNAAGLNNTTISTLSVVGVNGAFVAANDANAIGSPGSVGRIIISEVAPWSSGNGPVGADWFEVTNNTAHPVDLTGWRMDDSSETFAASAPLEGITTIAPGESVIFLELANKSDLFKSTWFGANPPAGLQIGTYGGIGLGTTGDAVVLYNASGVLRAKVSFGASPGAAPFGSFDNTAGLNGVAITQLSTVGVNGAFVASGDPNAVGSPGSSMPGVVAPTVSIAGATVVEGDSGATALHLVVARSLTSTAFTVDYAVTGGSATAGTDYAALMPGTLTFTAGGALSQTITITVNGDTAVEPNETVQVTLSNLVNTTGATTITTALATGTITNDDTVPFTNADINITTANTNRWPAGGITLNGTQFVNLGLQGVGRVPANSIDPATGESVGSISDMQISGWTKNGDGSYSGTFNFLPDRGYNAGVIYSNYAARINQFTFNFTPYTASTPTAAQNQVAMTFAGSTRFTYDHDGNAGTPPIYSTGLLANNTATHFGGLVPSVAGNTTQSDGTFANRMTIDSEGLILDKRAGKSGSGWMSDEYGPYIYHFNAAKQIDGFVQLPAAILPHAPAGTTSFVDTNVNGRRTNQGMEGIAQSPGGGRLFGLVQSATLQDSGAGNQGRFNTRLLVYDVSGSDTPGDPVEQYVIQLPRITSSGNGGAPDRTGAQSSILALNDHQLLILSRDGNGRGATGAPVFKSILLADLSTATNIDGPYDAEGAAVAPGGVLAPPVTPLSWTEALNMIGKLDGAAAEVAKFGLNLNAAPGDINSICEKWEALELVSANDPANPNDFFLFIGNDNDFQSATGQYMDAAGNLQSYNSGLENDTLVLAYRVRVIAPDISLFAGVTTADPQIADGQTTAVDFGSSNAGVGATRTFTVRNTGTSPLTGLVATTEGADFAIASQPAVSSLKSGETTTFTVTFTPSAGGVRTGVVRLASSAPGDRASFDFNVSGTGLVAGVIAFDEPVYSVDQGATLVALTIERSAGTLATSVTINTDNGTASVVPPFAAAVATGTPATSDYVDLTGAATTVQFGAGETTKTVNVTLVPKTGSVPNKRFSATLSAPTGGATLGTAASTEIRILAKDTVKPTLILTTPAAKVSAASPYLVTGTAGDAKGIAKVEVSLNSGPPMLATLGTAKVPSSVPFSLPIVPLIGTNTITVTAYDLSLDNTTSVTRSFTFSLRQLLTVTRVVPALVTATPDTAGMVAMTAVPGASASALSPTSANSNPKTSSVLPNTVVKLTATSKTGYVFSHWTGLPAGATVAATAASFAMPAGEVSVQAHFAANPFLAPAGQGTTFFGLVHAVQGTPASKTTEGFLTGALTATTGAFTGKLLVEGVSQTVTATFLGNGSAWFTQGATRVPALTFGGRTLALAYNAAAGNNEITATLTTPSGTSTGVARRAIYNGSTTGKVPAGLLNSATKGFYTLGFPSKAQNPAVNTSLYPQGDGYTTMNLTNAGAVTFTGVLADGTAITGASGLVAGNTCPIFVQLPTPGAAASVKGGSFGGEMVFAPLTDSDVSGTDFLWFRPAAVPLAKPTPATNLYTAGWPDGIRVDGVGALYNTATKVQTTLGLNTAGNAALVFSDGRLTGDVTVSNFTILGSTVTKTPKTDNTYTLVLGATTCAFSGTFTPNWASPATAKPAFKGILIQKGASKGGYGFFISNANGDVDPESGGVTLGAP